MITKESELAVIEEWSELAEVLFNEGIDTNAMTEDERQEAIEVWNNDRTRFLSPDLAGTEVGDQRALDLLISHFGDTRSRNIPTFCPICGETNLIEVCPATTYYPLRAVRAGGLFTQTVAGRQECEPPSVGDPEVFRCTQCDFETERPKDLLRFALIGGEVDGKVVIEGGIRVELLFATIANDRPRSEVKMDFHYPDAPAGWVNVVDGNGGDCLTVPVAMTDDATRKETVMRRAAEEVKERLLELAGSQVGYAGIYDGWQIAIGNFTSIEETLFSDEQLTQPAT